MSYRTEDGKYRKPKEIFPTITEAIKNHKFWNKRRITYLGDQKFFDQEVRTGICYLCKREGRAQKKKTTVLHHLNYEHSDPLAWTLEVCTSCHWHIDEYNRKVIERSTGRKIERRTPHYETRKQKEQRRKDGWMRFVRNIRGQFYYLKTNEKIPESVIRKWKKMYSEKETMSSVSSRYFMPKTEE